VELTTGDETGRDRVPLCAVIAAAEGPIGSTDDLSTQRKFAEVVVEAQLTVVEKSTQRFAMVDQVVHRLGDRRLLDQQRPLLLDPLVELVQDRLGCGTTFLRVGDAGVQFRYPLHGRV
jgi:hypothetical protein